MKTIARKMKSTSYDQNHIKAIADLVCQDIEGLLESLAIDDYRISDNMIIMKCPIHGGDNVSALNLYYTGDSYRGNWKCRSHKCEETFMPSVIGFIRGCLSKSKYDWEKDGDTTASFKEALEYAFKFTNQDTKSIKLSKKSQEKNNFVNNIRYINTENANNKRKTGVTRNTVKNNLEIPSKYFLSRNFSKDILVKYDVGDCYASGKEMCNRAVVPIYDNDHQMMIGCSGRTIDNNIKPKWRHSSGFKSENVLYNYWYAKKHIQETGIAILVESPGNVWKLEEAGIHNSLGIFGSSLADKQRMMLDISGAMTIITIMDNDEAGIKAAEQIKAKCCRTYNVKNISISEYNDIGEMHTEEIKRIIIPKIKDCYR